MPADLDNNGSEAMTLLLRLMLSERRGAPFRTTIENIQHQIFIRQSSSKIKSRVQLFFWDVRR
jgi:hypothetical protein